MTFLSVTGKAVPFVELTVAHASVLTILAISFERYYAICEPLKAGYVCTKARAMVICLLAWTLAAIFTRYDLSTLPSLAYTSLVCSVLPLSLPPSLSPLIDKSWWFVHVVRSLKNVYQTQMSRLKCFGATQFTVLLTIVLHNSHTNVKLSMWSCFTWLFTSLFSCLIFEFNRRIRTMTQFLCVKWMSRITCDEKQQIHTGVRLFCV